MPPDWACYTGKPPTKQPKHRPFKGPCQFFPCRDIVNSNSNGFSAHFPNILTHKNQFQLQRGFQKIFLLSYIHILELLCTNLKIDKMRIIIFPMVHLVVVCPDMAAADGPLCIVQFIGAWTGRCFTQVFPAATCTGGSSNLHYCGHVSFHLGKPVCAGAKLRNKQIKQAQCLKLPGGHSSFTCMTSELISSGKRSSL